ncbi:hypothetical protein niasHT_036913 [Heterodera trifolii]|uniref:BTB/POZ domain-containing protein n=1 Tax=Heterodera trifolii TaxID=157864 RepID=A0ABD2IL94_9BILA
MPSSVERMKHLLSTGKHSDVHFLVGDGDAKELLPSHQLILKNASDVFEAMFLFDANKEQGENTSANCLVVEIPDVEPAAFKVMLSFIYADDLSGLNGDNAMAVIYAAKKYNIPDLVDRSLQIPISELRNVFFAYAQARLFELEDFSFNCLRYICQNAAQLFESADFLQIDQKILCNLLDNDRLLFSDEFEILKIALRWADQKCRQNGIECSSENRRAVLGPALYKIRLPNILVELFSIFVVPSGLLTEKEMLGIYQFNSHPNLYRCGVPKLLYSLNFPSHGRIFDWNKATGNRRGTLAMEIEKVSEFAREIIGSERKSETVVYINGFSWKILAQISPKNESTDNDEKWLGIYLMRGDAQQKDKICKCSATFRIVSPKGGVSNFRKEFNDIFEHIENSCWGYSNFISFAELMDPSNGFCDQNEDKVTLTIDFTVKEIKIDTSYKSLI